MAAPQNPDQGNFPHEEQPKTYPEWLDTLECTCPAGAKIRPSSLPSATIDLGDIIADHTRILSVFTSAYSVVTVILKMIACIIDVLCCLVNPFCIIYALIKLFGTCLPDFILIFPQLAIPAIIICIIKIILAIVEYILTVLLPLILEIIQNIQDLISAITDQNEDAIKAIAFKLAALLKELMNVVGILSVLSAIWIMIKALLAAGIAIPCGGSGGSCSECGDEDQICPSTLQQTSFGGTDGRFIILYESDGFSYEILFYSASREADFLRIRNFFPKGLDYTEIDNEDDVPYTLSVNGSTYFITSVDSGGYCSLYQIPPSYSYDGYLANTDRNGVPYTGTPVKDARFSTDTSTFVASSLNRYITMQDTRGATQSHTNGGSWQIQEVYDAYNVKLTREDGILWNYGAPNDHLRWKLEPSPPTSLYNLSFEVEINHEELIRHGLIPVGCHPAVKATKTALANRFPDLAITLPALPDFDALVADVNACVAAVAPTDVDSQWVLDNYQTIASEITNLNDCVSDRLNSFKTEAENYAEQIYPIIFNPEDGYFDADPRIQVVGEYSDIQVIPYDRNGGLLGITVPSEIVEVSLETDFGTLSPVVTELDGYDPTGEYTSSIISLVPGVATIKAQVGGRYMSYFDGYELVPREVEVEFVTAEEARRRISEGTTEPLGRGRAE